MVIVYLYIYYIFYIWVKIFSTLLGLKAARKGAIGEWVMGDGFCGYAGRNFWEFFCIFFWLRVSGEFLRNVEEGVKDF